MPTSVFPAKHTILPPFGGENRVFRVGKMAGLSSYRKDDLVGASRNRTPNPLFEGNLRSEAQSFTRALEIGAQM